MPFELHKKLAADCELLGDLDLCTALLMRDDRFPWVILVPRIAGLRDLHDLPRDRVLDLFGEITAVSRALVDQHEAEKINVAALVVKHTCNDVSVVAGAILARRGREVVPGSTSSGRNAARGALATTRRARPQAPIRVVGASRRTPRYDFETPPSGWTLVNALIRHYRCVRRLGNQVPQLHVHVIGRYSDDEAWPGPVWNASPARDVDTTAVRSRAVVLRDTLGL